MVYRNAAQPSPLQAHRVESLAVFYTSLADGKEGEVRLPPPITISAAVM
jgi:hypothetical protein